MQTYRTKWFDFDGSGFVAYRIWQRVTEHQIFQRHEWKRADGSTKIEKWIDARGTQVLASAEHVTDEVVAS